MGPHSDIASAFFNLETLRAAALAVIAWIGGLLTAWLRGRERYQVHFTWRGEPPYETPVMIIQSLHALPINVTRVVIYSGRWKATGDWPFDGDDPDYPDLPVTIDPLGQRVIALSDQALSRAAAIRPLLTRLRLPRVYVGVQTMGRRQRKFVAERGLPYPQRLPRYQ